MAFNTLASAHVLSSLGPVWRRIGSQVQTADTGWDTLRETYAARLGYGVSANGVAGAFPVGAGMTGTFWVCGVSARAAGGGIWVADVTGKGLAASRPVRQAGGAATAQRSVSNCWINGRLYPQAEVWDTTPTLEIEYLSYNPPPTHWVGTAVTNLVGAPAIRRTHWYGDLDRLTYNFPAGWVVADMRYDRLLDLNIWLITIAYEFRFEWTP